MRTAHKAMWHSMVILTSLLISLQTTTASPNDMLLFYQGGNAVGLLEATVPGQPYVIDQAGIADPNLLNNWIVFFQPGADPGQPFQADILGVTASPTPNIGPILFLMSGIGFDPSDPNLAGITTHLAPEPTVPTDASGLLDPALVAQGYALTYVPGTPNDVPDTASTLLLLSLGFGLVSIFRKK